MIRVRTIDAHAAGEPLRLIVDGFPSPRGKTMLEKREWVRRTADHLRKALMLEPRGHADMYGAILTEPAETNELVPRITAVGYFLSRMAGGKPAFILNRRCKVLRKGFNGGYHVERVNVKGSEAIFKDRPAKNSFSHPHDGLQYLALRIRGGGNRARAQTVQRTGRSRS